MVGCSERVNESSGTVNIREYLMLWVNVYFSRIAVFHIKLFMLLKPKHRDCILFDAGQYILSTTSGLCGDLVLSSFFCWWFLPSVFCIILVYVKFYKKLWLILIYFFHYSINLKTAVWSYSGTAWRSTAKGKSKNLSLCMPWWGRWS